MWTIEKWKIKGCREIPGAAPLAFSYDHFSTREAALKGLRERLDKSLKDAEKRVENAKKWIEKAKAFGLYPIDDKGSP